MNTYKTKTRRRCNNCRGKISPERRIDALYCGLKCKSAASRTLRPVLGRPSLWSPPSNLQPGPPRDVAPDPAAICPAPTDEALTQMVLDRLQRMRQEGGLAALVPFPALSYLAARQAAEGLILVALRNCFPHQRDRMPAPDPADIGDIPVLRAVLRFFPGLVLTHALVAPADLRLLTIPIAMEPVWEWVGLSVLVQAGTAVVVVILAPKPAGAPAVAS